MERNWKDGKVSDVLLLGETRYFEIITGDNIRWAVSFARLSNFPNIVEMAAVRYDGSAKYSMGIPAKAPMSEAIDAFCLSAEKARQEELKAFGESRSWGKIQFGSFNSDGGSREP